MIVERIFLLLLSLGLSEANAGDSNCRGVIAFSSSGVHTVHATGLIQFRSDLFNSGHGWVRDTGTFTVMCPGVYKIDFSFWPGSASNTRLVLKRRGTAKNTSWVPLISTAPGGGSNSIIINLSKAEQIGVVVSNATGTGVGALGTDIEQHIHVTSFSAHRIDD